MKKLLLLLALPVISFGQTSKIVGNQIFICPPATTATLIIQTSTGLSCLPIDGNTIKINAVNQLGATIPGGGGPTFIDVGVLTGTQDGVNLVFTLSGVPNPAGSLSIYRNGLHLKLTVDYTFSGSTITFVAGAQPQPGDVMLATWRQ